MNTDFKTSRDKFYLFAFILFLSVFIRVHLWLIFFLLLCQTYSRKLPPQMRVKKVAVSFAAVVRRRGDARAAQNHLIYHKLAVVFADCARRFFEIRIRQIRRIRPFPAQAPIKFITRCFPFKFGRQAHSFPFGKCRRLKK